MYGDTSLISDRENIKRGPRTPYPMEKVHVKFKQCRRCYHILHESMFLETSLNVDSLFSYCNDCNRDLRKIVHLKSKLEEKRRKFYESPEGKAWDRSRGAHGYPGGPRGETRNGEGNVQPRNERDATA